MENEAFSVYTPEVFWKNVKKEDLKKVIDALKGTLKSKENTITEIEDILSSLKQQAELEKVLIGIQKAKPNKLKPEFEFEISTAWQEANKKLVALKYDQVLKDYDNKIISYEDNITELKEDCKSLKEKIKYGKKLNK